MNDKKIIKIYSLTGIFLLLLSALHKIMIQENLYFLSEYWLNPWTGFALMILLFVLSIFFLFKMSYLKHFQSKDTAFGEVGVNNSDNKNIQNDQENNENSEDYFSKRKQALEDSISGCKNNNEIIEKGLWFVCHEFECCNGMIYEMTPQTVLENGNVYLKYISSYGVNKEIDPDHFIELGDGLPGTVAQKGKPEIFNDLGPHYFSAFSGLGEAMPSHLAIIPVQNNNDLLLLELASFTPFSNKKVDQIQEVLKVILNKLEIPVN